MVVKNRPLGSVKLTQVQPGGLIIKTPSGKKYAPSRRVETTQLLITPQGIAGITPEGERLLDIHHTAHPDTHFRGENNISLGFTAHYKAMREHFGEHILDGTAGENIIIEFDEEVWVEDLGQSILIESPDSTRQAFLDVKKFAAPCEEFSHFAANSPDERLPAEELKAALNFLGNGRRGFYLMLSEDQEEVTIQPGDAVFAVEVLK